PPRAVRRRRLPRTKRRGADARLGRRAAPRDDRRGARSGVAPRADGPPPAERRGTEVLRRSDAARLPPAPGLPRARAAARGRRHVPALDLPGRALERTPRVRPAGLELHGGGSGEARPAPPTPAAALPTRGAPARRARYR